MKVVKKINDVYRIQRDCMLARKKPLKLETVAWESRDAIMIHGFGRPIGDTWWEGYRIQPNAASIARFFTRRENLHITGGWMPYPILIMPSMTMVGGLQIPAHVVQTRCIEEMTPHGWRWNRRALAICTVGTIGCNDIADDQYDLLYRTVCLFSRLINGNKIVAHSKAPKAQKTPHDCPGYPVEPLAEMVLATNKQRGLESREQARRDLINAGFYL